MHSSSGILKLKFSRLCIDSLGFIVFQLKFRVAFVQFSELVFRCGILILLSIGEWLNTSFLDGSRTGMHRLVFLKIAFLDDAKLLKLLTAVDMDPVLECSVALLFLVNESTIAIILLTYFPRNLYLFSDLS